MNWKNTPPTKPGAYWWRVSCDDPSPDLVHAYPIGDRLAFASVVSELDCKDHHCGGEWSGPLVPVEEVRRAFYEGHISAISSDPDMDPQEHSWPNSRARKVVEGGL